QLALPVENLEHRARVVGQAAHDGWIEPDELRESERGKSRLVALQAVDLTDDVSAGRMRLAQGRQRIILRGSTTGRRRSEQPEHGIGRRLVETDLFREPAADPL